MVLNEKGNMSKQTADYAATHPLSQICTFQRFDKLTLGHLIKIK